MTGTVVRSRPAGGAAAVVFAVLAVVCLAVAAAAQTVHPAVLALLPAALAVTARLLPAPAVRFEVAEDGLEFRAPTNVFVRFDDIQGLTAAKDALGDEFGMQLYHTGGVVRIPPRLNVSSRSLYRFLLSRLAPPGADREGVPRSLRGFLDEQLGLFGPDKVFVYRARRHPPLSTYGRHVAWSLGVAAAGLAWVVAAGALTAVLPAARGRDGWDEMVGWFGGGVALVVLGLVFALAFSRASGAGRARNWRESCLVVSPGGIALVQARLRGKMRWDELRAVEFPARPRFGLASAGGAVRGIGLLVEGAYLVVADYYDRPLALIYSNLKAYWGGREAN